MIITCALSPFSSLTSSNVASSGDSALSTKPAEPITTEKIKSEISELEKQKTQLETKQNDQYSSLTEEENKRLSDCESKLQALQTVKKLAEFADQLDTNKHRDNNILNNLCSGLEKFLGFNKDSKGYDGSGIVYSDLDRLCDGVMGFLSGVLDAVKDENEVTTYYSKQHMTSTIDCIKNSMHKGPSEYHSALVAAAQALELWNGELEKRTDAFRNKLTELQTNNLDSIENYLSLLNDLNGSSLVHVGTRLANCISEAKNLSTAFDAAEKEYWYLDETLKDKLRSSFDNIKLQVKQFEAAATNEELKSVLDRSGYELQQLSECVTKSTEKRLKELQKYLAYHIASLHKKLETFSANHYSELRSAIDNDLHIAIETVKGGIVSLEIRYNDDIVGPLVTIVREAQELKDLAENEKRRLKEQIEMLHTQMERLKVLGSWVAATVTSDPNEVINKLGLQNQAVDLTNRIKENVREYVGKGLAGSLKVELEWMTDKIAKGDKSRSKYEGHLDKIDVFVRKYAQLFSGKDEKTGHYRFGRLLGEWSYDILRNDPVKKHVDLWIRWNKDSEKAGSSTSDVYKLSIKNPSNPSLHSAILAAINEVLKADISQAGDVVENNMKSGDSIQGTIEALMSGIDGFAQNLEAKIDSKCTEIVTAIEKNGKLWEKKETTVPKPLPSSTGKSPPVYDNEQLKRAVTATLVAIHSRAKKIAEELKSFAGENIFRLKICHHVDEAIKAVKRLGNDLKNACALATATGDTSSSGLLATVIQDGIEENVNGANVKKELSQLLKDTADKTIQNMQDDLSQIVKDPLTKIKEELEKLQTRNEDSLPESSPGGTSQLQKYTNALHDKINTFLNNTIGQNGHPNELSVYKDLNYLNGNIALLAIQHRDVSRKASDAADELDNCILEANNLLTYASKSAQGAFNRLSQEINSKIRESTKTIQEETKEHYYRTVRKMFDDMKLRVHFAITDIKRTVKEDKDSGVKGLLRHLEGNLNINGLPHSPENKLMRLYVDNVHKNARLRTLSDHMQSYLDPVLEYTKNQVTDQTNKITKPLSNPPPTVPPTDPANTLTKIKSDFDELLNHLKNNGNSNRIHNYDKTFVDLREDSKSSLHLLSPSAFANPRHPELLDAVKEGLDGFVGEMERVYVNKYEGAQAINWDDSKSYDGANCAKILLTLIDLFDRDFITLGKRCNGGWKSEQIDQSTRIGEFLRSSGYVVSNKGEQNGELRNKPDFKGEQIMGTFSGANKLYENWNSMVATDPVKKLFARLHDYRKVCHLKYNPKAKAPTTVYQMLLWLTGLEWNNMFTKIKGYIPTWYDELTAGYDLGGKPLEVAIPESKGFCTIQNIDANSMAGLYNYVTIYTEKVLIAILGHGQENGRYACDFYTNRDDLDYPSNVGVCFDMFIDICMRLNQQLRFLYKQCENHTEQSGWRDCHYGKGIAGSSWNCNSLQCPNQIGDQSHKQKCDQKCDQTSKCGVKSPLQSFLEDGLQGFLPHQFTSPGCKLACSVRDHTGKTCLTPMGFADIGIAASHTKTGEHLRSILEQFCGTLTQQLTMICAYFTCLQRRPPQTLGDMFAFYHNFLGNWKGQGTQHKYNAFNEAVRKAYFGVSYEALDPSNIQVTVKHNDGKHSQGDLFSLLNCDPDSEANLPCGQYLQPLSLEAYCVFTEKQANLYLSWIMYMTETFYDLLAQLWNQCCRNCDKPGSRCHDRRCSKKCTVKSIYETTDASTESQKSDQLANIKHQAECNSIVKCQNTHPTIYKYGFTFGSPYRLSGPQNYQQQMRTCKDFCEALKRVLAKDSLLVELIRSIDEFLWKIREYFTYTVVALWSASFLYLLYVYIGRLDTLHIRSHLRTPASHKITAQSLLAAARVGRLSKIAYLQP